MRITIVTPTLPDTWSGNRATSRRWAKILRELGHQVRVSDGPVAHNADLLVALHARKSAESIAEFSRRQPRRPLVVALTGTDLWQDGLRHPQVRTSLELADRLIVLQMEARQALPVAARAKASVIYQSSRPTPHPPPPTVRWWEVAVVGHLRDVKDPLRTAIAARQLPAASRIRVVHLGNALTPEWRDRAEAEMACNARYRWLGGRSVSYTRRRLARSRLLVVSSYSEGGANVVSEAVADRVPILATDIPGNRGLLGEDYPGYFSVGDTSGLAERLARAEANASYYAALGEGLRAATERIRPAREIAAWSQLLAQL